MVYFLVKPKDISISDETQRSDDAIGSIDLEKGRTFLKIDRVQEMLYKFLSEKKMESEKLAEMLQITTEELESLLSQEKVNVELVNKINLPLIKLYCATNWLQK